MFQAPGLIPPIDAGVSDEAAVARVTAAGSPAFGDLLVLLRLLSDPAAFQAKLDQLMAATVKANEAKTAMVRQQQANTARENEFEHWQKQLAERFMTVQQAEAVAGEQQQRLLAIAADIRRAEDVLKREVLRYAGITVNETLQQLPSFAALASMVLGGRNDAHLDGDAGSPREHVETVSEPVPDAMAGATVTRSVVRAPKPSRTDRRREG